MANITAADVNKLRQQTRRRNDGLQKALVEADGDFEKAIEILRKKGQKVAANRADRNSSEGAVIATVNDNATKGVIVALNCETDFVGKNESFVQLARDLAKTALENDAKTVEDFLKVPFGNITVGEKLIEQTGVIGEKIEISNLTRLEGAYVGSYIHNGNKLATLVSLSANVEGAKEAAHNVAMQAAAMNPIALDEAGVAKDVIEKEIEIAKELLRKEGKPEAMLDNIAKGKLARFFKDNTLDNQEYIMDNKVTVAQYVASVSKELIVTGFARVTIA